MPFPGLCAHIHMQFFHFLFLEYLCFRTFYSPSPKTFNPVESKIMFKSSPFLSNIALSKKRQGGYNLAALQIAMKGIILRN